ncbi:hypothetical protein NIES4101_80770 [Calothrix sp. NIES-4101]|nr:hypothetical protein NIES4101_80770 [Calothrix sp. NIES-4101]
MMKFFNILKDIIISVTKRQDWWVEISTAQPNCIYYFGPFPQHQEAEIMSSGYVEDLQAEGAREIKTIIKRCHPDQITICEE